MKKILCFLLALCCSVPDYLRERGILPDKKSKTIEDRLQDHKSRFSEISPARLIRLRGK